MLLEEHLYTVQFFWRKNAMKYEIKKRTNLTSIVRFRSFFCYAERLFFLIKIKINTANPTAKIA